MYWEASLKACEQHHTLERASSETLSHSLQSTPRILPAHTGDPPLQLHCYWMLTPSIYRGDLLQFSMILLNFTTSF